MAANDYKTNYLVAVLSSVAVTDHYQQVGRFLNFMLIYYMPSLALALGCGQVVAVVKAQSGSRADFCSLLPYSE